MGGKFHLKLNIGTRPIANKYREGKMKSTLKRRSKVRETVKREPLEVSSAAGIFSARGSGAFCMRSQRKCAVYGLSLFHATHYCHLPRVSIGLFCARGPGGKVPLEFFLRVLGNLQTSGIQGAAQTEVRSVSLPCW